MRIKEKRQQRIQRISLQKNIGNKLCLILITGIIAIITAGCANQQEKERPAQKTSKTETAQKIEKTEDSVPTLDEITALSPGTILDTTGLSDEQISECFSVQEVNEEIISRINNMSYQENPYIKTDELRYLRILHVGFDGKTHIGELLVNQSIAEDVLEIMEELYQNEYPIEKMLLIDEYGADDEASMSDNNSSAFNYRLIAGTNRLSKHGQGLAIDINPKYNPCVRTRDGVTTVEPQNGWDYANRTKEFSYKIAENDICCRLFKEHGFVWGGDWNTVKDYQHFEWKE